jgi:hypothetical protein
MLSLLTIARREHRSAALRPHTHQSFPSFLRDCVLITLLTPIAVLFDVRELLVAAARRLRAGWRGEILPSRPSHPTPAEQPPPSFDRMLDGLLLTRIGGAPLLRRATTEQRAGTPEALILRQVYHYESRRAAGFTEWCALSTAAKAEGPVGADLRGTTFDVYLRNLVEVRFPQVNDTSFERTLNLARPWATAVLEVDPPSKFGTKDTCPNFPPREWLRRRYDLVEFEHQFPTWVCKRTPLGPRSGTPTAHLRSPPDLTKYHVEPCKEWLKFKEQILPGDELWVYCSPPETWRSGLNRGYALLRDGCPIHFCVTVQT